MNHVILVVFALLMVDCSAQDIAQIEFRSLSRAYSETVIITPDSVSVRIASGRGAESSIYHQSINAAKWSGLLSALHDMDWQMLDSLPSPTQKRAYDGAKHSTLLITYDGQVYRHSFDDRYPHELLSPLMYKITLMRNQAIAP